MIKWVVIFFVVLILILAIFYNLIIWAENKVLFFPSKRKCWKPKDEYKSVYLNVEDRKDVCSNPKDRKRGQQYIHGWHFNNFKGARTVLYFHSNTGNITNRKYVIDMCRKFKINLFLAEYRGYGCSCSFPHKLFLREDGETAFQYLHHHCKIPNTDIILWSESLGCVSASYVASKYNCGALIMLCAFSSLDDAVNYNFKGGKRTVSKFVTDLLSCKVDFLEVKDYLLKVKCPVVVVHSKDDEIIPYACSWINYHSVKHNNKMHIRIKGGHSSPNIKSCQLKKIFDFCDLSLDNLSSDVNISDILDNLRTVAKRHNNFID